MHRQRSRVELRLPAAAVALAAGVLTVVGSLLGWLTIGSVGVAFQGGSAPGLMRGLETGPYGWVALASGLILAGAGAMWLLRPRLGRPAGVAALVAGALALGVAILATLTRDSIFTDFVVAEAASPDLSAASIRDLMGRLFEAGSVSVRPSVGLYLVGIGGIGGIVAGVLSRRVSPPASSTARFADTMVAGRAAGGQADSLGPAAGEDPRER